MLRHVAALRYKNNGPQVIGAEVPSFERFPFKARAILHLYRDFWRLIYRFPPQERQDLIFRLRNEFRSKRHLAGSKVIVGALKRGEGVLEVQKSMLEMRGIKASGAVRKGGSAVGNVDVVFEQLQTTAGHMLPGLKNYKSSVKKCGERYADVASTSVYSRARPLV